MRNAIWVAAAALILPFSVSAQDLPPLRTAIDGTFAPHAFPNMSGGYQGFNIDLGNEIAARLKQLPQLADVASDLQDQGLQAYIEIDRDAAGRLGVTPSAVDYRWRL